MTVRQYGCKRVFLFAWCCGLALKLWLAARVPLFVDEAFYWQESRHPAWAYSDLPGLTAWLAGLGPWLFGPQAWALRLPFVLLAAAVPWLVVITTRRVADAAQAWLAGLLAMLLPLSAVLGVLALPDVPMTFATALCIDAGVRLLRRPSQGATWQLAAGLLLGGLSHYRFAAVIAAGFAVLLWLPEGRRTLAGGRVWMAIAVGALAWLPLLLWNLHNGEAGLRFQLVDRHPWRFHWDGAWFAGIQTVLVTPLMFAALLRAAWRHRASRDAAQRYLAWSGGLLIALFFVLGFVADNERVSFHWPLPAYLALLPLVPSLLAAWPSPVRHCTIALTALGALAAVGYLGVATNPQWRSALAASKAYPANFAGWSVLADAVRTAADASPPGTQLVADNFKIGAELGFLLDDPRIPVLDHPLNHHHGRAPQLALWQLHWPPQLEQAHPPLLLVVGATDVPYRDLLARYHALCRWLGPLPAPQVVNVDRGRTRYLLFNIPPTTPQARRRPCVTPAMAWIDTPEEHAAVKRTFTVTGWAFKDGAGLTAVDILLDRQPLARARYGLPSPGTAAYWQMSTDPHHPDVGFSAQVQVPAHVPGGRHWLGLRLHGRDGSTETWSERPILLQAE